VFGYKMQSLMIGGVIGALAGMYLAIDQQSVTPDFYIPLLTFYAFTIVIIGGPGTLVGPILGSMIFWFIFESLDGFMTRIVEAGWTGDVLTMVDVGALRFVFFGIGLMLLMIYRPQGILGKREEMLLDAR
jgi:branched-chain amino acid transport system permease protein